MSDSTKPKIVIQAGHINCQNNSIVSLRRNTGAPGEQELNYRIASRVAGLLRDRGFTVKQTDACANDDKSITSPNDWDLFIAIHGDSDIANDNGGGFADYPEPSTDGATEESQRIAKIINDKYFPETKIVYENRSNANTRFYYMWKYLSSKTPCVLIELGQVQDPHDRVLLANTELIGNALAKSICLAFGIEFDKPQSTPVDPKDAVIADLKKQIEDKNKEVNDLKVLVEQNKTEYSGLLAQCKENCQKKGENIIGILHSIEELINS